MYIQISLASWRLLFIVARDGSSWRILQFDWLAWVTKSTAEVMWWHCILLVELCYLYTLPPLIGLYVDLTCHAIWAGGIFFIGLWFGLDVMLLNTWYEYGCPNEVCRGLETNKIDLFNLQRQINYSTQMKLDVCLIHVIKL